MSGKAYAVTRSDAEWRRILTPEQYDIMRSHGTEAPGSCTLLLETIECETMADLVDESARGSRVVGRRDERRKERSGHR